MALFLPLLLFVLPVFWRMAGQPEEPVAPAVWVLLVLSALANVAVIIYHYTVPAHPKFLMLPWRRWVLRVHITAGTIELVAGLMACFRPDPTAAVIMAVAALFFHVPTALLQTRIVFGSKAVMVPGYLFCILAHAFCAGMLLTHPASVMWAANTFLVFNVYVWCRVYFYFFDLLGLFAAEKYTVAILAAGCTMGPAVFGPLNTLFLVAFIALYVVAYRVVCIRTSEEQAEFVRERAREGTLRPDVTLLWGAVAVGTDDAPMAEAYFRQLDQRGRGELDRAELCQALAPWGRSPAAAAAYADRLLAGGPVGLERFKQLVWTIGAVRYHGLRSVATEQAVSERDKAELVFRHLDLDGDGSLTSVELGQLLENWGLPRDETAHYLARAQRRATDHVSFDEFFHTMRPMWRFIYYEIFRAEYASRRGEMIGRSVAAYREARKAEAMRVRVQSELLCRVPFLEEASESLIADLAASLVATRCLAGQDLFREGGAGDKFYLVGTGVMRVSRRGEALAELGQGGCLGEGALLTEERRTATATAVTDATLYALTRASFQYLTEKYPHVRARLQSLHEHRRVEGNLQTLHRRMAAQVPFLHQASAGLIADLAASVVPATFATGQQILREGEAGDRFYIVEEGQVRISKGGETLAQLGSGACFGEGALLSQAPRIATATALTETRLFALTREAFDALLARHPAVRSTVQELHLRRSNPPTGPDPSPVPS